VPLLASETLCAWLAEAIDRARQAEAFDLWGYVFMPEHVHLLLMPTERRYSIARVLAAIKRPVAYRAIGHLKARRDPLLQYLAVTDRSRAKSRVWQAGGGHDRNLQTPRAIHAMLDYIHYNPVARGLVTDPCHWRWSSARA
jgi:putative transposase